MKNITIIIAVMLSIGTSLIKAEEFNWPFLDNKAMGTYDFIKENPNYDGKGVVIFILDNSVDPSIPGLVETSHGEIKVIDMQDFSGQLMLNYSEAEKEELENETILKSGKFKLSGWDKLELKPSDGKYYISGIDEKTQYMNSAVKDINNNTSNSDMFGILIFKLDETPEFLANAQGHVKPQGQTWVYYIDEDADGNIDDEEPKVDYKYDFDTFDFFKGESTRRPLMTMSANILPASNQIMINTTDGSHGSHCGGIAAGHDIYGTEGNDGIAPGAYIVSLKIGDNSLAGGATTALSMKKAYEYGVKFMEEAGFKYGVYSMSYGIGAETPGLSDIEKFLDGFCKENPNVVVVTSNGNEGPGINSTGTPAGSNSVISVGAMLTPEILNNLYGSGRTTNWVTHFSSRGAECPKPDVIAPAGASSTVPAFEKGDAFWGTSMSCPQVAGACAVLLSAALDKNWELDGSMIKKAIKFSADMLPSYSAADQGNGLVNISKAYTYLEQLVNRQENKKIYDYHITSANTYYPENTGPSFFMRAGGYIPLDKQNVTIKAVFSEDISEKSRHDFYRVHRWKTDKEWLSTDKNETYLRGELPSRLGLKFDKSKMTKPGLYIGKAFGYAKNEKGEYPDIEVQAALVVPHKFNSSNNYALKLSSQSLKPGDIDRIFIEVPTGASSMNIKITSQSGKYFGMASYLYRPDGNGYSFSSSYKDSDDSPLSFRVTGEQLNQGIWELLPYCYYQSTKESFYDIEVRFSLLENLSSNNLEYSVEQGSGMELSTNLIWHGDTPIQTSIDATVAGYGKKDIIASKGKTKYSRKFKIDDQVSRVDFHISMDSHNFNKFTDLAVNIKDANGKVVRPDGMSRKYHTVSFLPQSPGEYTLEMIPGFSTEASQAGVWEFVVDEKFYFDKSNSLMSKTETMFYPKIEEKIMFTMNDAPKLAPAGYMHFVKIHAKNTINAEVIMNELIYITNSEK